MGDGTSYGILDAISDVTSNGIPDGAADGTDYDAEPNRRHVGYEWHFRGRNVESQWRRVSSDDVL